MNDIRKELEDRVLVLDGAMGTMIQKYGLSEKDFRNNQLNSIKKELLGNNDLLSITRPDIIKEIHVAFLEAGADIIETNTFNSTSISQADYDAQSFVYELNKQGAKIASNVAKEYTLKNPKKPRFVAGSIGPTNRALSLSPDVNDPGYRAITFDKLKEAYKEQINGLLDGGIDVFLVETVFDTLNAKAALFAIEEVLEKRKINLPVMVSGTVADNSGRTLSGQTPEAFLNSLRHVDLLSIGFNCSLGAKDMRPHIEELASKSPFYISAYPNAGLPNQFGEYDQTPEEMASQVKDFIDNHFVNIIGGCCGTTPQHITRFAEIANLAQPHVRKKNEHITRFSGLEPLTLTKQINFLNIGERCNVSGSKMFARLIREKKYEEALSVAAQQVENGAQVIDVNLDDAMLDAEKEMSIFLNLLMSEPEIAKLPIMIDSSKWEVIEAGLKCLQGKAIVNSISLKEGEAQFLNQAQTIKRYGASVVVMAFDEKGQADNYERKIEICNRAYSLLTEKLSFPAEDIIFDPNILAIGTGIDEHNNYAVDFIEAVRWIKKNLPYAKTSGGVSNVSFSFRGNNTVREAIHSVFLFHAIEAGLDMGIVNPGMLQIYNEIDKEFLKYIEDLVLNRNENATEQLLNYAQNIQESDLLKSQKVNKWRNETVEKRLQYALIKGIQEYLEEDLQEAIKKYKPTLSIIEKPLMEGMNTIGELFGSGKMFLPQVIKSARVMKKAVAHLQPIIEEEKTRLNQKNINRKKILLATVKGDVHDIGKNIVGVVLSCNNYDVIDLGVMVKTETIINEAVKQNVDVVGLSGLITPSLEIMVDIAKHMQEQGLKIPLIIGGATTSEIHTAVKIAPQYNAPVIYVKDASRSVNTVANLLANNTEYLIQINNRYKHLRELHNEAKNHEYLTIEEAKANKFKWKQDSAQIYKPNKIGVHKLENQPISEIRKYIDWTFFFHAWELKGKYPEILNNEKYGKQASKLLEDAEKMLDEIIEKNILQANAVFGIWSAKSEADDIVLYKDETCKKEIARFYNLRQQRKRKDNLLNYCLSDFIAPKEAPVTDYIGGFALTAGIGLEKQVEIYKKENDDYNAIMLEAISDRLAEAFAEFLHEKVRKEYWGYAKNENLTLNEIIKNEYQGIRPALGYPSSPDHHEKEKLFELLDAKSIGMSLTEHYAMQPTASVCGQYYAHPESKYFAIEKISKDQAEYYAKRKNVNIELIEKFLPMNLNYKK